MSVRIQNQAEPARLCVISVCVWVCAAAAVCASVSFSGIFLADWLKPLHMYIEVV